jgi:hypothetical protein
MSVPETLAPPFPPLPWDGYAWASLVQLPAWAGLHLPDETSLPTDGTVEVRVSTENDEPVLPSPEQAAAYEQLTAQAEKVREAILVAVFEWYQQDYLTWRDENGYDEEEAARYLPELTEPAQLTGLMQLTAINVFPTAKDGLSYTGYEFVCSWEEEHGLGAMLHGSRVVEVGGADTAILEWIAARDAEA